MEAFFTIKSLGDPYRKFWLPGCIKWRKMFMILDNHPCNFGLNGPDHQMEKDVYDPGQSSGQFWPEWPGSSNGKLHR